MRNFLFAGVGLFFILASCVSNPEGETSYVIHRDVVYSRGESWELGLDIAVPRKRGPHPVIVYFYGSAFREGDRTIRHVLIPDFISRGYGIAFVTYRAIPEFRFPAPVHDAKNAVRYLRANAEKLDIDPDRIVAHGFSSGGYLALMLGLTGPDDGLEGDTDYPGVSSAVTAVVSNAGPTDFSLAPNDPVHSLLLGGTMEETPDTWVKASAVNYAGDESDVPILYIAGGKDHIIVPEHGYRLDEASHTLGTHTLVVDSVLGHVNTFPDIIWWFIDAQVGD
jgi:acetyl esterase/lipase